MDYLQPYRGAVLNPKSKKACKTRGSWRPHGGSLTKKSPRAGTLRVTKHSFGGWERTINVILNEYWRRRKEEGGEEVKRLLGTETLLQQEPWIRSAVDCASVYPQADLGGAGRPLTPCTTPGREYTYIY